MDVREHGTAAHSRRVAEYALRLAAEMGIDDPEELAVIGKGALLHDDHDAATHSAVPGILRAGAGKMFDPAVVAAFERVSAGEWETIASKFAGRT